MRRKMVLVLLLGLVIILVGISAEAQNNVRRVRVLQSTSQQSVNNEGAKEISCAGKVVNSQGEPINGVKVGFYELVYGATAYSYDTKLVEEMTTLADGAFSFSVSPRADGYQYGTIVADKEGLAIGFDNWDMKSDRDCKITLGEAKQLAGVVVDENDRPIADAEVSISMMSAGTKQDRRSLTGKVASKLLIVRTDTTGKFTFTYIPADATAELLVKKPGRAMVSTFDPSDYRGDKLHYAPGQTDIKLVQPIEAKVEGIVVEKDSGKPVAGIRIIALKGQNLPSLFGEEPIASKEDGTFAINALTAGKHILQVVSPREVLADWVAEPVEIKVKAGEIKSGVKIELSKGGLLEVVVTETASGKPIEKASVSIQDEKNNQWLGAQSDKDGVARIRLLPGEYKFSRVYKEGYTSAQQEQTVTIEKNKTARLQMQLKSLPKVSGVVRDETGKAVEGADIRILPMGDISKTTDTQGKFEFSWDPSRWGPREETVFYLVARDTERNLAAAADVNENTKTMDIKLTNGVILAGKVVDPNGKGIGGAKITVMLQAPNWGSSITDWQKGGVKTDAEGKFEVKAIPVGYRYTIVAQADGYGQQQMAVHTDDAVDNRLEVEPLILAVANLSISGIVVDVNDKPVIGVQVNCHGHGQPNLQTQTDSQGKFTIEKVCAGRLNVSAYIQHDSSYLNGYVQTEGGATDVKVILAERGMRRYVPREPPSLVGKALPELKDLKIELSAADANNKMILVCFWDMEQRPSRHYIQELVKQVGLLGQKGVTVVAVQASKVDKSLLDECLQKFNISFPVGMIEGDAEKVRFNWGVKSLPWLILTDRKHVVQSNGFTLGELDEKLKQVSGE